MTLQLLEPEVPSEAAMRKEQEALELVVAAKETLTQEQVIIYFICFGFVICSSMDKPILGQSGSLLSGGQKVS